ncbi:MAG: hypothetical protein COS99_07095 [Candidatus Omnitrophica bacterium CG07_land_8_20_14_0_80_42_15]|uniref:Methyltransferase type 11 domain-containing protein n=1 Tax=Candidatus Aquitaenariimonas noxiae TaxID=1974741 RepID=A0A2J0L3T5_9BACT|nr:MAG: hypothetical protein COS99_07095 [Candidatus Omnitrophica bacterium CG07_land_8_20_14_0_80_42_15]
MCKSHLIQKGDTLYCADCNNSYPIEDGIPNLLPKKVSTEFSDSMNLWNKRYSSEGPELDEPYQNSYIIDNLKHINRFWASDRKGFFLEAGCGTANVSRFFSREGRRVVGIDFSMNALKKAKAAFNNERLDFLFVCCDIRNLPFRNDVFEFIYAGGSIEHFEDTKSSVAEFRRTLKPGGKLTALVPVISLSMLTYGMLYGNLPAVPGFFNIAKFVHHRLLKGKFAIYGYEKSFTVGQITNIFENGGLNNIETGYYDSYYEIKMFKSEFLKNICKKLLKHRLFWPMIYVNGEK